MQDTRAKFTTGSILRHVLTMTGAGSAGLMAIFLVDFLNLFYISLLGEQELAAAIGFAGTLLFLGTSVSIGIMIAGTALVSRAIGAKQGDEFKKVAASALLYMGGIISVMTLASIPFLSQFLDVLGAQGRTHEIALRFLYMTWVSTPLLGVGMMCAGLMRAIGDAKRSMTITMTGGLVVAVLDPILIFALGLGVDGAAIASVISRLALMLTGFYACFTVHKMVVRPSVSEFGKHTKALTAIALPAMMTNVSTPVGNMFVTAAIAPFGDAAVAAWAVLGRITPLAWGATFALSAAVSPIIGQNFGARVFARVRQTINESMKVVVVYCMVVWAVLALAAPYIASAFSLTAEGTDMVIYFCMWVAGLFVFNGALFVSNAAFNNLGAPIMSMLFNWGRATIGTIPFIWVGGQMMGANGVLLGQGLGAVIFGLGAVFWCYHHISKLEQQHAT